MSNKGGRPRIELPKAMIREYFQQGMGARKIQKALKVKGIKVSVATVSRRLREL